MALRGAVRWVLPLLIIAGGVMGLHLLGNLKRGPAQRPMAHEGVLVEVVEARPGDHQVVVRGTGVVRARRRVTLTPQVAGRVVWVSPRFVAGGRFRQGEKMVQIERKDYLIALKDAEARLSKALQELEVAENRSKVERRQWERLHPDGESPPTSLVFFEPQLKAARAAVEAARAVRERAALDLARTEIRAPFDCLVASRRVSVGAVVGPGQAMGEVLGVDVADVVVPVAAGELRWLRLPADAEVALVDRGVDARRRGRAVAILPAVDEEGRLPRIRVEVAEPFEAEGRGEGRPILADGSFVEVAIRGALLHGVYSLPAAALHRGDTVWLVGRDHRLAFKEVEVIRRTRRRVVVRGLSSGDRVVTTMIQGAAPGMKVRVAAGESS